MSELPNTAAVRAALILARFRDKDPDEAIAAGAGADPFTYGDLRALLTALLDAQNRLERIAVWHARETAGGGLTGDYCIECAEFWPCDSRRMADGAYEDKDGT